MNALTVSEQEPAGNQEVQRSVKQSVAQYFKLFQIFVFQMSDYVPYLC